MTSRKILFKNVQLHHFRALQGSGATSGRFSNRKCAKSMHNASFVRNLRSGNYRWVLVGPNLRGHPKEPSIFKMHNCIIFADFKVWKLPVVYFQIKMNENRAKYIKIHHLCALQRSGAGGGRYRAPICAATPNCKLRHFRAFQNSGATSG